MSAIYKEGYWYPADSLNTLKAVTMSNEDYEALTPQEKEELGGIEIFIPDRPLTGGGTGAVIIYNDVEYAGTPTSRLETLEEKVGTGTLDIGDDLTDGVNQLNSSLSKFINGGEKTCTVNSSGLLNLSVAFNIPPNAYDINVEVINDTVAPSGVVRWINGSWYVFVLTAGTGNTIERRPNTDTTVRCSWRIP